MAPFDIKEIRQLMEGDDLELDKIGDRKTARFCIVSDTDMTFNFISAMVYTQMFNVLCDKALENGGALKTHVTCLLDEFANQKIPNFQHLISVIRSREISAHIVVQTQSQLKVVYKDHAGVRRCFFYRQGPHGNSGELERDRKGASFHAEAKGESGGPGPGAPGTDRGVAVGGCGRDSETGNDITPVPLHRGCML